MFAFDLSQVRHTLFRKGSKIRARVAGRQVPTIETEAGRAGVVRAREADWLAKMELQAEERRRWAQVLSR